MDSNGSFMDTSGGRGCLNIALGLHQHKVALPVINRTILVNIDK